MWRTGKWLVESYGHAAHPSRDKLRGQGRWNWNHRPPKGPNPQFASSISQEARQRWNTPERRTQDVDNIPKRILDALTDIVFEDDKIIAQTLATQSTFNVTM